MKIVIAPDSFKESLSAIEVAGCIEEGFREVFPDATYVKVPIADGGEGTVEALVAATKGRLVNVRVTGPLGDPVEATYGVTGDGATAVIEMAAASGLALVPKAKRNPLLATSFGTGELIRHALDSGLRNFIIGIGGSATNDAGAGMLQALGVHFVDEHGLALQRGGGALSGLSRIDRSELDKRLQESRFLVACDVNNPLTGPRGASCVFGPQKGASPEDVEKLDVNLSVFARVVRRETGVEINSAPGAGAAGGMGAALLAFLDAELKPGIEIVVDAVKLEDAVADADLVITGEGRIDGQSIHGKAPVGVARVAAKHNVPVIGFAGSIGDGAEKVHECGISALFSVVSGPCDLSEAFALATENIRSLSKNVAATIEIFFEDKP